MRIFLVLLLSTGLISAQDTPSIQPTTPGKKLWQWSVTSLVAANTLDIQSSWGKHELNPALSGLTKTFGGSSLLLKAGLVGGLVGLEYLVTRGHSTRRVFHAFSIFNFGAAAVTTGVAAHNYTVSRRTE